MPGAYYNEIDPIAAQWLRNLIAAGHIAPGDVDERSIVDVRPDDLRGYRQCHFFAGVGVWSYALRRAGWEYDREVWTGSCPCQPFSDAGAGLGFDDERHLFPAWAALIGERRPIAVLGEQVASKAGLAWLDVVHADLEAKGYTVGALDLCAAGVGAPHIRQRIFFVADASDSDRRPRERGAEAGARANGERGRGPSSGGVAGCAVVHPSGRGCGERGDAAQPGCGGHADGAEQSRLVVDAERARLEGHRGHVDDGHEPRRLGALEAGPTAEAGTDGALGHADRAERRTDQQHDELPEGRQQTAGGPWRPSDPGPTNGFWRDAEWIACRDGKARPVEPGTFPLAHGAPARVGRLRAYGNAINAEAAIAFIEAYDYVRRAA
jgi:DNA (cytosine-5)-methyltransferase 1